jgi:methyl farnesoate epoxidase/farnesoate epoxidase
VGPLVPPSCCPGGRWASQRNFSVKHLRNFGFGRRDLETVVEREAAGLVRHFLAHTGQQMKVEASPFSVNVLNVLWEMVAGHAFRREDKEFRKILDQMNFIFTTKVFGIAIFVPWIRFVLPSLTGYTKVPLIRHHSFCPSQRMEALKAMQVVIRKEMDEHKKDLDPASPRWDYSWLSVLWYTRSGIYVWYLKSRSHSHLIK